MTVGLSTSYCAAHGLGIYDSIKKAYELGFELVEMGAAHKYEDDVFGTLKRAKKDFPNLEFTVHAYFPPIFKEPHQVNFANGIIENKPIIDATFHAADILECKVVSMHPGSKKQHRSKGISSIWKGFNVMSAVGDARKREDLLPHFYSCVEYALEHAQKSGIPFALETLQRHSYTLLFEREEYIEIFEKYPELNLLLDIGHCHETYGDPYWFMDTLGDRTVQMHLHDYNGKIDHVCLGTGITDMDRIFSYDFPHNGMPLILEHAANITDEEIIAEKELVESYLR